MAIKIIGAGFPRTGTSTLKKALEMLGMDECYHMKNLITDPFKLNYWNDLKRGKDTDWGVLFEGFQAIVDIPGYLYYQKLMEQYPDAKVILSKRPFEKWYASVEATVYPAVYLSFGKKLNILRKAIFSRRLRAAIKCIQMVEETFFDGQFEGQFKNKEKAEAIFNAHIESVKAYVPEERLLVYEVTQGWEPLCEFLGVPVPEEELPHLNKKENFQTMLKELIKGHMVN